MKWKNACLAALLGVSFACGIAGMQFASNTVSAGKTGAVLADDNTFIGTELDYGAWRYDRNSGIGFRELRRRFSFSAVNGDDAGMKATVAVPEGSGTAVDIELASLDVSKGGWLGINYGSLTAEKSNGAFWDCLNAGNGKLHYFEAGIGGKLNVVFLDVVKTSENKYNYGEDEKVKEATFYDGEDSAYPENQGSFVVDAPQNLENQILREYYGANGDYELSIRDYGASVAERKVLLKASGLDANPGGYLGMTFMSMRSSGAAIDDFAAYECSDTNTENSVDAKIFGFVKEGEKDTLDQFTLAHEGSFLDFVGGSVYSIAFDETSDIGNPLLNRSRVTASEEVELTLEGGFTVKINDLVGNKKFGAVFGVPSLSGDVGDAGTSYLWFAKQNDVYGYGLTAYADTETELIPFTPLPGDVSEKEIKIDLRLYADGRLVFGIDGQEVYAGEEDGIQPEGYFGFAQSGNFTLQPTDYIDAEIYDLQLRNEFYAKPEAPDVFTDFNDNTLNAEEWLLCSTSAGGSGLGVVDGALVFDGAGQNSNITSRYSYSNFELRFDISGAKNTPTIDATGNVVSGASYWIAITFGAETASAEDAGYSAGNAIMNGSFVYFDAPTDFTTGERTGDTVVRLVYKGIYQPSVALPEKYAFFNEDFDPETVVTVQVTVLDGVLRVGMKTEDEVAFTQVLTYQYENSYTPNGHISIYSEGNQYITDKKIPIGSTYTIDNLGLYNWDENGNVIEVGYTSNVPEFVGDYDYIDPWVTEINTEGGKTSKGCNSMAGYAAIVPAVLLAGAAVTVSVVSKRREKK